MISRPKIVTFSCLVLANLLFATAGLGRARFLHRGGIPPILYWGFEETPSSTRSGRVALVGVGVAASGLAAVCINMVSV